MELRRIPLSAIEVGKRRRPVDTVALEALVADIAERGLRTPIEVAVDADERTHLVAGLHRLHAARLLSWTHIDAVVVAGRSAQARREDELLENLCRIELTALERCQFVSELKEIHRERSGARHGGDRRSAAAPDQETTIGSWYFAVAQRAGCSAGTIKLQASIGYHLDEAAADTLRGTPFEARQSELLALSRLAPDRQRRVVLLLTADDESARAATVADAVATIEGRAAQRELPPPSGRMHDLWNRASRQERRAFVALLPEDDLADAVAARGFRLVPE